MLRVSNPLKARSKPRLTRWCLPDSPWTASTRNGRNKIAHYMTSDADLKPPRELYPIFYGCFDWHSSVHGHWLLVRMLNTSPDKVDREAIISKLNQSFTADNVAGELRKGSRGHEIIRAPLRYCLASAIDGRTAVACSPKPRPGSITCYP